MSVVFLSVLSILSDLFVVVVVVVFVLVCLFYSYVSVLFRHVLFLGVRYSFLGLTYPSV